MEPRRPADAHRHQGLRARQGRRAPREPRLPRRRVGFDGRAEQAPACRQLPQAPPRHPGPRGHGRNRGLLGRGRHRAAADPGGRAGANPRRPRTTGCGRFDGRWGGDPAGLPPRRAALRGRRDQPGDPRHRRRLQRRHHRFERARGLHRAQARERGVPLRTRVRHGQLQRCAHAAPRPERERQRRLHRQPERSEEGPRRRGHLDALPHREGREDPGGVQSGRGERVPAHRLRDADARPRRLPQRPGGRGRDRLRPHRHRHLRGGAGRFRGRTDRAASLPARGNARDGHRFRRRACDPQDPLQAPGRRHQHPHHPCGDHRRCLRERGRRPARNALRRGGGRVWTAPPGRPPYRRLRLRRRHHPRARRARRRPLRLPHGVRQTRSPREVRRRHGAPRAVTRSERSHV